MHQQTLQVLQNCDSTEAVAANLKKGKEGEVVFKKVSVLCSCCNIWNVSSCIGKIQCSRCLVKYCTCCNEIMTPDHGYDCSIISKKQDYKNITEYLEYFIKMAELKTSSLNSFLEFFYSSLAIFGNIMKNFKKKNDPIQLAALRYLFSPFTRHIPLNIPDVLTEKIIDDSLLSFLYLCIKTVVLVMPRRKKFINATRAVMDQFLMVMGNDHYKQTLRETKILSETKKKFEKIIFGDSDSHTKSLEENTVTVEDVQRELDIYFILDCLGYSAQPRPTFKGPGNVIVTIFGAFLLDLVDAELRIGYFPTVAVPEVPSADDKDNSLEHSSKNERDTCEEKNLSSKKKRCLGVEELHEEQEKLKKTVKIVLAPKHEKNPELPAVTIN